MDFQKVRKLPKWVMNMAKYSFGVYLVTLCLLILSYIKETLIHFRLVTKK